ncbi:unnamed protein product [Arctia plantaginis]|uniref:Bifunctional coenzyme A synthase n=1 Tax=Arctia plantaginis TaxID=874455 RepID=A0A8S0YMZ5_ARCPL|nr:unnamed protein product [Arctia plantaginis]
MNTTDEMANNGLLFISNVGKVHMVCQKVSQFVRRVLYVNIKDNIDLESALPAISNQIDTLYSRASAKCSNLDVRLMLKPSQLKEEIKTNYAIDMILYDSELAKEVEQLKASVTTVEDDCKLQSIDFQDPSHEASQDTVKRYENVAVGGTFDRLHNGHKILLSQAALRSTKHLTVGVTDVNMIQSKKLWELIEPVETRINVVLNFLKDINPDLEYNVFPLQDLYGPTKDDPKYELIIVSEETAKGASKINEKRVEGGLAPIDVHVIGLAPDTSPQKDIEEENKVSSSNQRMRLLGTLLRPPVPNLNIPDWPYVIGLAGGIGSGKSSVAQKLKNKGAAIVDCDLIAHELYKPGLPLNGTLAENFGQDILTHSGEIDRKKLGQIVFSDKDQLDKLNSLVWPEVIAETQRRIQLLGNEGHRVVIMEAAVMVRAKWYQYCHQLWTVFIPRDEAIKRIQERNKLSEEEARQRVDAQPSNMEQIALANIVFSPYWSYDYTQKQIDRAWDQLQEYLATRN